MDIVTACENFLGWQPDPHVPIWKARAREINKLQRAIGSGTKNQTIANLRLALDYSRRKRLPIDSPYALLYRIPDALALAYIEPPMSDITRQINEAIRWEQGHDDAQSLRWIYRLTRCMGRGRDEVLDEWKAAGRG